MIKVYAQIYHKETDDKRKMKFTCTSIENAKQEITDWLETSPFAGYVVERVLTEVLEG